MIISELIEQLQQVMHEAGDVDVKVDGNPNDEDWYGDYEIDFVYGEENKSCVIMPKYPGV